MARKAERVSLLTDTRLSDTAARIGLVVASKGPGWHEMEISELQAIGYGTLRAVEVTKHLRALVIHGHVAWRAAGRAHGLLVLDPPDAALAHSLSQYGRQRIPADVRTAVMERDKHTCLQCGSTADLQLDHIVPAHLGGASTTENLRVLCGSCNRARNSEQ